MNNQTAPNSGANKKSAIKHREYYQNPDFADWITNNLNMSFKEYFITDIDYIIRTTQNDLALIEVKCMGVDFENKTSQVATYRNLDTHIKRSLRIPEKMPLYIRDLTIWIEPKDITYHGLHYITFENTSPTDGRIFWNKKEIDPQTLLNYLRFDIPLPKPYFD